MEAFIVRAIALILTSLGTTQGRTPLELSALKSAYLEDRERQEREELQHKNKYASKIVGMRSPYEGITYPARGTSETDWLMGYDGTPYGLEMGIIIIMPLVTAKIISLIISIVRPVLPNLDKAPRLPRIPLYYLQSTQTEREIARPLRSSINWYAKRFIIRSDDDFIDRSHIRRLLKEHKKMNTMSPNNPWHVVRALIRLHTLKGKTEILKNTKAEVDTIQGFLDQFAKAMRLNQMHRAEEDAILRRIERMRAMHMAQNSLETFQNKKDQIALAEAEAKVARDAAHLSHKETTLIALRNAALRTQQRQLEEKRRQVRLEEELLRAEVKQARSEVRARRRRVARQGKMLDEQEEQLASLMDSESSSSTSTTSSDSSVFDLNSSDSDEVTANMKKPQPPPKKREKPEKTEKKETLSKPVILKTGKEEPPPPPKPKTAETEAENKEPPPEPETAETEEKEPLPEPEAAETETENEDILPKPEIPETGLEEPPSGPETTKIETKEEAL